MLNYALLSIVIRIIPTNVSPRMTSVINDRELDNVCASVSVQFLSPAAFTSSNLVSYFANVFEPIPIVFCCLFVQNQANCVSARRGVSLIIYIE